MSNWFIIITVVVQSFRMGFPAITTVDGLTQKGCLQIENKINNMVMYDDTGKVMSGVTIKGDCYEKK